MHHVLGAILLGVSPTVVGMIDAFNSIEETSTESSELTQSISAGLVRTMWLLPVALIGACIWLSGWLKKPVLHGQPSGDVS